MIRRVLTGEEKQNLIRSLKLQYLNQFYTLLKPFKNIIVSVQNGDTPSLYLVSMCFIMLKEILRSFQSVKKYDHENIDRKKKDGILDDINDEDLRHDQHELPGTYV